MIDVLTLAVLALAVARGAYLMAFDDITAPVREAVRDKFGPDHLLTKGVYCPWCWSVWIAFSFTIPTVLVNQPAMPAWNAFITFLAVAYVGGYLADRASR